MRLASCVTVLSATWLLCSKAWAEESPTPAETASAPTAPELSRIELKDGQVLRGKIVDSDSDHVTLELTSGGRLTIPRALIGEIRREQNVLVTRTGEIWFFDPNRTRYLLSPSAMMLRQWEGYFSQTELLGTTVSFGLTNFFTLTAGTVFPFWFANNGFNFIGGIKLGTPIGRWFHLAAGTSALVLPFTSEGGLGFAYGTATVGNSNLHLSLTVGYAFGFKHGTDVGDLSYAISGSARLSRGSSIVTENWIIALRNSDAWFAIGGAFRIFGEHWAADIGLIGIKHAEIPIPWLSFSYAFGT